MDDREIRLRIVEVVVAKASQVGIVKPELMIETCTQLENYVLGSKQGEEQPTSPPVKRRGRPPKETTMTEPSQPQDPAMMADKSNQSG